MNLETEWNKLLVGLSLNMLGMENNAFSKICIFPSLSFAIAACV